MGIKSWTTDNNYVIYRVLSGRSNAYLILHGNLHILVDTGTKRAFPKLLKAIGSLPLLNIGIDYLILTHTHFDHCRNAAELKKIYNCKVILGLKEKLFAETGILTLPSGTNRFTKLIVSLGKALPSKLFSFTPFVTDIPVENQYVFKEPGLNIQIIETPGHSPGSVSIIVDNSIAIVGDTLFGVFRNSVFPPYADDSNTLMKSWQLLLNSNCQLFLPGHGREIKRMLIEKAINKRMKTGNTN
jgi:glyoxylase-like metal-dependent hydrolase (beta-lactamase superfamily II)